MKLYLVRHGDAVSEWEDSERPLSSHGIKEVKKTALELKERNVDVSIIFHSTKQRAQQTAEMIKNCINPKAQLVIKKYLSPGGSIDELEMEIGNLNEDLMIVSHLPFLPRLIEKLIPNEEKRAGAVLKTGSVIALEQVDKASWRMLWSFAPSF